MKQSICMDLVLLRNTPSLLVTSLALSLSFVVHCAVIYSLAGVDLSPKAVQSRLSVSILQSQLPSQEANEAGQNDRSEGLSGAHPSVSNSKLENELHAIGSPAAEAPLQKPLMLEQASMVTVIEPDQVLSNTPSELEPAITNPVAMTTNDLAPVSSKPHVADLPSTEANAEISPVLSQSPKFQLGSLNNPEPGYPPMAIKRGWQGEVLLSVEVGSDGHSRAVDILSSSGYSILDRAALETIRDQWIFIPAMSADLPILGYATVPVSFRLD